MTQVIRFMHRSNRANWLAVARSRRADGDTVGMAEAIARARAAHELALWAL